MQGLVLTSTDAPSRTLNALVANHIPLLKVITGWGAPWHGGSISHVLHTMPEVLIRTVDGDGCRPPPPGESYIYCHPDRVAREIEPWLIVRENVWVELGNEPNGFDASDDAAWTFRYWFLEALAMIRARWPAARVVSPGLVENRQETWWAICQDAFVQADAVGFHAYAYHTFAVGDTGQIQRALEQLGRFYPTTTWIGTELGINDPATSPNTKAERYKTLHAKLPSQVLAACWYHICAQPADSDQSAYALPESSWPYLKAGGAV